MPKRFRWWSVMLALVMLLITAVSVLAQEMPTDKPDKTKLTEQVFVPLVTLGGENVASTDKDVPTVTLSQSYITSERDLSLLSPEERAEIEESKAFGAEFDRRIEEQIQQIQSLVADGEVNASSVIDDEQMVEMISEMSWEELQVYSAQRNAELEQMLNPTGVQAAAVNAPASSASAFLYVNIFEVPNQWDLRNACGPNAVKITLSTHLPTNQIPGVATIGDTIAAGDWRNNGLQGSGDINRLKDYVVNQLNTKAPSVDHRYRAAIGETTSAVNFRGKVIQSIAGDNPMIFGVQSQGLPDWHVSSAHIITARGYVWASDYSRSWIHWADGNNIISGHCRDNNGDGYCNVNSGDTKGKYWNSMGTADLWDRARFNNWQVYDDFRG